MNKYKENNCRTNPTVVQVFKTQGPTNQSDSFTCLEIGCNLGDNLKAIFEYFPNGQYYGSDISREAIIEAKDNFPRAKFILNDIEGYTLNYLIGVKFDYIILADVLEHLTNPYETLRYIKKSLLKPEGKIIANIPNLTHYTIMYNLLTYGTFHYTDIGLLDYDHKHLFTYEEIWKMFEETGYEIISCDSLIDKKEYAPEEEEFINKLLTFLPIQKEADYSFLYKTFCYIIVAKIDNKEKL